MTNLSVFLTLALLSLIIARQKMRKKITTESMLDKSSEILEKEENKTEIISNNNVKHNYSIFFLGSIIIVLLKNYFK